MRRITSSILFYAFVLCAGGAQALSSGSTPEAPTASVPQASPQSGPVSSLPASPALLPDDPASLLGLSLPEAFVSLGVPASVSAFRGEEAWQDDVIFSYAAGYSLFWFGDRLWQIRLQSGYAGSAYGIFLGDQDDKVYSLLGTPFYTSEDSLVYRLPYRGFPVRLRLVLAEGRVQDMYLYRADF